MHINHYHKKKGLQAYIRAYETMTYPSEEQWVNANFEPLIWSSSTEEATWEAKKE